MKLLERYRNDHLCFNDDIQVRRIQWRHEKMENSEMWPFTKGWAHVAKVEGSIRVLPCR